MEHELLKPSETNIGIPAPDGLADSFPVRVDFYGLWVAELKKQACALSECAAAPFLVAFQVTGEIRGAIVVAFDREPTPWMPGFRDADAAISGWTELANVLAAKLASQLADRGASDVMISPPDASFGSEPRLRFMRRALLAGGGPGSMSRLYELNGERPMVLRMAFLPGFAGGTA